MLTRLYVEALLGDQELADQVWELWDSGLIPDDLAAIAWWVIPIHMKSFIFGGSMSAPSCRMMRT